MCLERIWPLYLSEINSFREKLLEFTYFFKLSYNDAQNLPVGVVSTVLPSVKTNVHYQKLTRLPSSQLNIQY